MKNGEYKKTIYDKAGRPTGAGIGKALIKALILYRKNPNAEEPFTQAELDALIAQLTDPAEVEAYNTYAAIYNKLSLFVEKLYSLEYIANEILNRHILYITRAVLEEIYLIDRNRAPVIATQTEYNRLRREAIENIEEYHTSYRNVVFSVLKYCRPGIVDYRTRGASPETPKAITAAIEAYKGQPITRQRIHKEYLALTNLGRWKTADGKSAKDIYTQNKRYTAVERQTRRVRALSLLYKGGEYARQALKKQGAAILKKATDADIEQALHAVAHTAGAQSIRDLSKSSSLYSELIAHIYNALYGEALNVWEAEKELPQQVDKAEALLYVDELYGEGKGRSALQAFDEFIADYPQLYGAIKEYIEQHLPIAAELHHRDYAAPIFKDSLLYEKLAPFKYIKEETAQLMVYSGLLDKRETQGAGRLGTGLAVMPDFMANAYGLKTEAGDYRDTSLYAERLVTEAGEKDIGANYLSTLEGKVVKAELRRVVDNIRGINAIYALLDIYGRVYGIKDIDALQEVEREGTENRIIDYNRLLVLLYADVHGIDEKAREAKRAILKEIFPLVDISYTGIETSNIKRVEALLKKEPYGPNTNRLISSEKLISLLMGV